MPLPSEEEQAAQAIRDLATDVQVADPNPEELNSAFNQLPFLRRIPNVLLRFCATLCGLGLLSSAAVAYPLPLALVSSRVRGSVRLTPRTQPIVSVLHPIRSPLVARWSRVRGSLCMSKPPSSTISESRATRVPCGRGLSGCPRIRCVGRSPPPGEEKGTSRMMGPVASTLR